MPFSFDNNLTEDVISNSSPNVDPPAVAFISSSFGFGPVAKAVMIAEEFRRRLPHLRLDFFGGGMDRDFARKAECFDRIFEVDVDIMENLQNLLPRLQDYQIVFSILNLVLLPLWRKEIGQLYFVDSLAWMWNNAPPAGIENVAAYFVQDYLVADDRVAAWHRHYPLVLIPPIVAESTSGPFAAQTEKRDNHLLVNFSGCANPFVAERVFENYASILTRLILTEAAGRFNEIQICCNQKLAGFLHNEVGENVRVKINHLSHNAFLQQLQTSRLLLTAPGITTTLEAARANIPFAFLLPQNDSQALMGEIYRRKYGDEIGMAFSSFGEEFSFSPNSVDQFDAGAAVQRAAIRMEKILATRQEQIRTKIRAIFDHPADSAAEKPGANFASYSGKSGQQAIFEKVTQTYKEK